MPKVEIPNPINNIVFVGDTHCGCKSAICTPKVTLDGGGDYYPSLLQKKIYSMWREFWGDFVPEATRGEPYDVVHVGDAIDGVHHNSTTQISHNIEDQVEIAIELMRPIVEGAVNYYHIRGTEAHVGKSGEWEERLAKRLGAVPNEEGQFARFDLWKKIGPNGNLIHCLHHIGTTGSQAYEATAVHKELTEMFVESGRWGAQPPDIVIRGHRHRCLETSIPVANRSIRGKKITTHARSITLPCWQGKTPFVWKIPGGRLSTPQFGGVVVRFSDDGELFVRPKVWTIDRSKVV